MDPEQILRRAIDSVPAYAIFVFDHDGTALTWNEGVRHVLGYSRDDWLGKDADRIFTPEDRSRGVPDRERGQAALQGTVGDFRWHMRSDGALLWASGSVYAVREEDGRVAGFVKIMRDATRDKELQDALERSRAELEERVEERTRELQASGEQLRRSESRFRGIFRAAPIAIALTTADDEILDANDAFERITGYARDEAIGRNAGSLGFWSSPEDRSKLREAQPDRGGFRGLELQLRTKDGQVRDILCSAAVVDLDHVGGLVKMFLDITERKRSERQLAGALQEVMQDTSWLAQRVVERLAQARGENREGAMVSDLTPRERDVLTRLAQGKTNEEIGLELALAPSTVRNYVTSIYGKIGVRSRAEAVVWARERGLGGT